jgi:two-component system OmpR family response regulator
LAKRILVVDDHAPTRTLIRTILESEKGGAYQVVDVAKGAECLMAADAGAFDLILLDVNLPDVDGFTLCRAIRERDSRVPIVFVTAQGGVKDFTAGREAGGDSYLVKPIGRTALRSLVGLFTSIERKPEGAEAP